MGIVRTIFLFFRMLITSRATITAENLALRHRSASSNDLSNARDCGSVTDSLGLAVPVLGEAST